MFTREKFLAAMSSSRSDDVTNSVCVSVCLSVCLCVVILLSLEILKYLKLDVYRVLEGCLKSVPREF